MDPEETRPEPAVSWRDLDDDSRAWVDGLRATGSEHARTVDRLHDLLLRAAYAEAGRRRHLYQEIGGAELDDLCRQAADERIEAAELLRALRRAMAEELTPRQRQVFVAVTLNDVQIDVVADQLGSTRGAVYKVLHDARVKMRRRLEREGHLEEAAR